MAQTAIPECWPASDAIDRRARMHAERLVKVTAKVYASIYEANIISMKSISLLTMVPITVEGKAALVFEEIV